MAKKLNDYTDSLGRLYEQTPKAVFAAIAVSALTVGGDYLGLAQQRIAKEWWILYQNGIVPQKPPVSEPPDETNA